jgi:hypothetical protein
MDHPIIAIAGDPGGANALVPVIHRLRQLDIAPIQALAYREALHLWQQSRLAPESIDGDEGLELLQGRLPDAGFLLTATSVNSVDRERAAFGIARGLGVPCLAVLDFWSNYRLRFTNRDGSLALPDRIAVMDELARSDMETAGFPAAALVVTGQPAFDTLRDTRAAFTPQHRSDLRRELGLGDDELLVLFVSQPFAAVYGSQDAARAALGFEECDVLRQCCEALMALARRRRRCLTLAIRPHPRESAEKFPEIQEGGFRAVIWNTPDQRQAALGADLVLGMNSVLLYEAALMDCKVVSVQPGLKITDPLPSNRSGASTAVYDANKLGSTLENSLFEPDRQCGGRVSSLMKPSSGNATEAVIAEIRKLLGARHPQARKPHA